VFKEIKSLQLVQNMAKDLAKMLGGKMKALEVLYCFKSFLIYLLTVYDHV